MHVQSLTIEGCLHIQLLNVKPLSALTEKLIMSPIYDITMSLEVKPGQICTLYKCDVAVSEHTMRIALKVKEKKCERRAKFFIFSLIF